MSHLLQLADRGPACGAQGRGVIYLFAFLLMFSGSQLLTSSSFAQKTGENSTEGAQKQALQDPALLETEAILKEALEGVAEDWRQTLFPQEKLREIATHLRFTLPPGFEKMPKESQKGFIRKRVNAVLLNQMRSVTMGEVQKLLFAEIEKLPLDWRAEMLKDQNFQTILQGTADALDWELLNLPAKERDQKIFAIVKTNIIKVQQGMVAAEVERAFLNALQKWPEEMRAEAEAYPPSALEQLLEPVLKATTPQTSRKEMRKIVEEKLPELLQRLVKQLLKKKITAVFVEETSNLGPGLTDKVVVDEEVFKKLIIEVLQGVAEHNDPVTLYKSAEKKIKPLVQKVLVRERDKLIAACMKEEISEKDALDPEKYWLWMPPAIGALPKEMEQFPFVDEVHYTCKAAEEGDLKYCERFAEMKGREGHDVQCKVFSTLFAHVLPRVMTGQASVEDGLEDLAPLLLPEDPGNTILEPLLRALVTKDSSQCKPIKASSEVFFQMCRGAVEKDENSCKGSEWPLICKQGLLAFEAVAYNSPEKLSEVPPEQIISPLFVLAMQYFHKNGCRLFFEKTIKKRYCFNFYYYQPKKEDADGERK